MTRSHRTRNLIFIFLGVLVLLFKRYYAGPCAELFYRQGANFAVSFAVYFIAQLGFYSLPYPRLVSAAGALLAVELFELTNGFGVMLDFYDPWDYFANALGVGLALGIDLLINRSLKKNRMESGAEEKLS
jgi:energy-coupling factor transporter transmembrane protein EcfT